MDAGNEAGRLFDGVWVYGGISGSEFSGVATDRAFAPFVRLYRFPRSSSSSLFLK